MNVEQAIPEVEKIASSPTCKNEVPRTHLLGG
jgi:hypothetical protein